MTDNNINTTSSGSNNNSNRSMLSVSAFLARPRGIASSFVVKSPPSIAFDEEEYQALRKRYIVCKQTAKVALARTGKARYKSIRKEIERLEKLESHKSIYFLLKRLSKWEKSAISTEAKRQQAKNKQLDSIEPSKNKVSRLEGTSSDNDSGKGGGNRPAAVSDGKDGVSLVKDPDTDSSKPETAPAVLIAASDANDEVQLVKVIRPEPRKDIGKNLVVQRPMPRKELTATSDNARSIYEVMQQEKAAVQRAEHLRSFLYQRPAVLSWLRRITDLLKQFEKAAVLEKLHGSQCIQLYITGSREKLAAFPAGSPFLLGAHEKSSLYPRVFIRPCPKGWPCDRRTREKYVISAVLWLYNIFCYRHRSTKQDMCLFCVPGWDYYCSSHSIKNHITWGDEGRLTDNDWHAVQKIGVLSGPWSKEHLMAIMTVLMDAH